MIGKEQIEVVDGQIKTPNVTQSLFNPPKPVKDLTGHIKGDFVVGRNNLNQPYREYGNESFLSRANKDQKVFNAWVDEPSLDPAEAWRYPGMRPLTRNKVMVMAAQLTSRLIYPNIFAQNNQDETDDFWAQIMRDLILWHIRNSDYEMSFLFGVIAALVNPISYFKIEFLENVQKIRTKLANGEMVIQEAVDEVFSGLNIETVPMEQILFANPYGGINIQKQRFIIRHRFIEYSQSKGLYGTHPHFTFVRPGIRTVFNEADGMFYDEKDDSLTTLNEEVVYHHRTEDLEIPFVNGLYMGKDNIADNPMRHRDNNNRPKYPYASFGYHPIDEKQFIGYRSLVYAMENEQLFVDTMLRMTVDGTFLSLMPPRAIFGGKTYSMDMNIPGSTHSFAENAKIQDIAPNSDLSSGYRAIQEGEKMANEDSSPETVSGSLPDSSQKAFNVARAETNARINMSLFGKMIGKAVTEIGELMTDIILTQQTVAETSELVDGLTRLKYKTFNLPDQRDGGKKIIKQIRFTDELFGIKMKGKDDELQASFRILKEEGGIDSGKRIINVNPRVFRKLKFFAFVDPDFLPVKSQELERELKLRDWQMLAQSPFADREAVDRDFLFEAAAKGQSEKYMKTAQELGLTAQDLRAPAPPAPSERKPASDILSKVEKETVPLG